MGLFRSPPHQNSLGEQVGWTSEQPLRLFPGIKEWQTCRAWVEEPGAHILKIRKQSWVLHREESLVCTMDAVYVAGIASLFTIPIPAGQLTWGHRDHHMVIFFLQECWRAEAVHQHCWWRLPRWFLKCFVVSEFEAGSDTEPGGLYMAWLNPVPFKQNCSSNNRLFSWGLLMVFLCNLTLIC